MSACICDTGRLCPQHAVLIGVDDRPVQEENLTGFVPPEGEPEG